MFKKLLLPLCMALFLSMGTAFSADKVNINTATQAELETIKGVGPSTASAIVEYREANGKFENINELVNVKGIGDKKVAKMSDQVTVSKKKK